MAKKRSPENRSKNIRTIHQSNPNAAGVDAGSKEHWVAAPDPKGEGTLVRKFPTTTFGLYGLCDWLVECGADTVAIEATGVYWVPLYEVLESRGLRPVLTDSRGVGSINGLKKSDMLDCQWQKTLHSFGLLRSSFIPSKEVLIFRGYMRQKRTLIESGSECVLRMQKALTLMNIRLDQAVTDITGVTGMSILREILKGERDLDKLAAMRQPGCAKSHEQIAEALCGHYREDHLLALQQAVTQWDLIATQISQIDQRVATCLEGFTKKASREKLPAARRQSSKRKAEPRFEAREMLFEIVGVDLTQIDGLNVSTILTVFSECGVDLSRFESAKHFCSWLGLSPGTKISGGKRLSSRTRRTTNRAATALRLAAQALERSKSALGAFYRRLKARLGPQKAITATAHKLARMIYFSLTQNIQYADPGPDYLFERNREKHLRYLQKKAKAFGMALTPIPTSPEPVSA